MNPGALWTVVVIVNAIVYIAFIRRRDEGSLLWTALLALVAGPLVWFVWIGMRSGAARSSKLPRPAP